MGPRGATMRCLSTGLIPDKDCQELQHVMTCATGLQAVHGITPFAELGRHTHFLDYPYVAIASGTNPAAQVSIVHASRRRRWQRQTADRTKMTAPVSAHGRCSTSAWTLTRCWRRRPACRRTRARACWLPCGAQAASRDSRSSWRRPDLLCSTPLPPPQVAGLTRKTPVQPFADVRTQHSCSS